MGAPRFEREGETARSLYKKKRKKNTQRIEGVELVRLDRRPTRFGHRPPGQALIGGGEGSEFRGVVGLKGGNGKKGWRVESETRAKTRRGAPPPLNLFSLSLSLFSLVTSFTKGDRSPAGRAASAAALASSSARIFRRRARAAGTRAQGEREKVGGGKECCSATRARGQRCSLPLLSFSYPAAAAARRPACRPGRTHPGWRTPGSLGRRRRR
jgi:hypothetical protein